MRWLPAVALSLLVGCAGVASDPPDPPRPGHADEPLYEADTMVLEDDTHGPMLCLGGIATSLPPQCGDVPIANWNWERVEGEERMSGTTWGEYHVVGRYDGSDFSVIDVGPARPPGTVDPDPIEAACPDPAVGWAPPNPQRRLQAAIQAARAEPDFSGVWVDTAESGPANGETILSVAFTGELERHEGELREMWGGPLCVVRHETTLAELLRIQRELSGERAGGLELEVLWSAPDEADGVLEVGVVVADADARAAVDERYGHGVVELFPALEPVS